MWLLLCAVIYRKSVKFVTISLVSEAVRGEMKTNLIQRKAVRRIVFRGDAASGDGITIVRLAFLTVFLAFSILSSHKHQLSRNRTHDEFCFSPNCNFIGAYIYFNDTRYYIYSADAVNRQRDDHPSDLLWNWWSCPEISFWFFDANDLHNNIYRILNYFIDSYDYIIFKIVNLNQNH